MLGSVPAAFCGVVALRFLVGDSTTLQDVIKLALGAALLLAATGIAARAYLSARLTSKAPVRAKPSRSQPSGVVRTGTGLEPRRDSATGVIVKRRTTMVVGALAGFVVGLTSVGSGSLVVVALLTLYPALPTARPGRNGHRPGDTARCFRGTGTPDLR
jgi:uncharacterized membrane protein YfcA